MDKTMFRVRRAQLDDARALAPRLREADRMEVRASSGEDPLTALERAVRGSQPSCAMLDESGEVLALFGVSSHPARPGCGTVWMMGSDALVSRRGVFLRTSKYWVEQLHRRYAVLGNFIDARNTVHLRWLHWLGFKTGRRVERFGFEQRPFIAFCRVRSDMAQRASNGVANSGE
jgi:hypothetical protein